KNRADTHGPHAHRTGRLHENLPRGAKQHRQRRPQCRRHLVVLQPVQPPGTRVAWALAGSARSDPALKGQPCLAPTFPPIIPQPGPACRRRGPDPPERPAHLLAFLAEPIGNLMVEPRLKYPVLLSILAAVLTFLLKGAAYLLTGSVGLLSESAE